MVCSLYSAEGESLGRSTTTDGSGVTSFAMEAGTYRVKLRVGYNNQQFWSGVIGTQPLGNTPVEMVYGSGGQVPPCPFIKRQNRQDSSKSGTIL